MVTLNLYRKPCPIPVVEAGKALQQHQDVIVLVDNEVAVQNLEKMATQKQFGFSWKQLGAAQYEVTLVNPNAGQESSEPAERKQAPPLENASPQAATILFGKNYMGNGEQALGEILIKGFIYSLTQLEQLPHTLIFLNTGAKLTTEESAVIEDLRSLAEQGVRIMTCGTCINFYELPESPAVGEKVDMFKIATALTESANTITI